MGYSVEMFLEIGRLNLKSNRVLDVGAQDVSIGSQSELDSLNGFIGQKGSKNFLAIDTFPKTLEAKEVYERAGYAYTNIDVDERPGTLRVDLARFEIPRPREEFDLVVNVGTTEHLANPVAAFALMHELCAEGGIIYHDVPLFGFGNHGLMNPTPKYWHALIWMNRYTPVITKVRSIDESAVDRGNLYHDYLSYMEGLSEARDITYLIRAILRKSSDTIFVVPYDAVFPEDDGLSLARLLAGSYRPFLATAAYDEVEVLQSINSFLKMCGHSYRVTKLAELDYPATPMQGSAAPKPRRVGVKRRVKNFLKSIRG